MCGITAMWGKPDETKIRSMMDLLVHRGPDADGFFSVPSGKGAVGHRRLSIMDPEGGNQPIFTEDGTKAIIANGEIYNFPRLYKDLSSRHGFKTKSDTEAVIHLYEELSGETPEKLDGMFAFVIVDGDALFAARDPIGIKPLYYAEDDGAMLFSSEVKSFPGTCRKIHEFPPGAIYHSENGFSEFYAVPTVTPQAAPAEDYIRQIRETLEDSVIKRLMSDVPLGAFLSGGIDSSIIAAIVRKNMDTLHTFSVGVEGCPDLEAARVVARHLDTVHHEFVFTEKEVMAHLPKIIYYLESFDQDLVRSAVPCYFTSRLAAEYVKVILTGEGADELFGGYTYYKDIDDASALHEELRRSVASLHNINLQRVDRMTMAHSIEGRVPFLDLNMIRLGQLIPAELKLNGSPPVEKWVLRKAFEDLLPSEIIWRKKEQFDEGSGTADALDKLTADVMPEDKYQAYLSRHADDNLRSAEECVYHQMFMDVFENSDIILPTVGRWAVRPHLQ